MVENTILRLLPSTSTEYELEMKSTLNQILQCFIEPTPLRYKPTEVTGLDTFFPQSLTNAIRDGAHATGRVYQLTPRQWSIQRFTFSFCEYMLQYIYSQPFKYSETSNLTESNTVRVRRIRLISSEPAARRDAKWKKDSRLYFHGIKKLNDSTDL